MGSDWFNILVIIFGVGFLLFAAIGGGLVKGLVELDPEKMALLIVFLVFFASLWISVG
jgi:hypothetical protein